MAAAGGVGRGGECSVMRKRALVSRSDPRAQARLVLTGRAVTSSLQRRSSGFLLQFKPISSLTWKPAMFPYYRRLPLGSLWSPSRSRKNILGTFPSVLVLYYWIPAYPLDCFCLLLLSAAWLLAELWSWASLTHTCFYWKVTYKSPTVNNSRDAISEVTWIPADWCITRSIK